MGTDRTPANARAGNFKLKKALLAENDTKIRLEIDTKEKVKNIEMPTKKIQRNYLGCKIMVQIPLPNTGQHQRK